MRSPAKFPSGIKNPIRIESKWLLYGILVGSGLLIRLIILLSGRVDLHGPPEQAPAIFHKEEIFRSAVAEEWLAGLLMPFHQYQFAEFFGGSLLTILCIVPLMYLLGPRMLATKLVPVFTHLLALCLLIRLLDKYVSRRAAWIGGALFALTPPGYTLGTTIAWGSHIESNALAMGYLSLAMAIWTSTKHKLPLRLLLGLVGGFGVYLGYQCALFIVAVALVDIARGIRQPNLGQASAQALGFVIGFLPWILIRINNPTISTIYGQPLFEHINPSQIYLRLSYLVFESCPEALCLPMEWGAARYILAGMFVVAMAVFTASALRGFRQESKSSRDLLLAVGLYLLILSAALVFSDFRITGTRGQVSHYRYLMLSGPWIVIIATLGMERWWRVGPWAARTVRVVLFLMLALNVLSTWTRCVDTNRMMADYDMAATAYPSVAAWIPQRYSKQPSRVVSYATRLTEERIAPIAHRHLRQMGSTVGWIAVMNTEKNSKSKELIHDMRTMREELFKAVPEEFKHHFAGKPTTPPRLMFAYKEEQRLAKLALAAIKKAKEQGITSRKPPNSKSLAVGR